MSTDSVALLKYVENPKGNPLAPDFDPKKEDPERVIKKNPKGKSSGPKLDARKL